MRPNPYYNKIIGFTRKKGKDVPVIDDRERVNTYMGKIVVDSKDLTPEFIAEIKADAEDKQGWKKYRQKMKDAGYDIE